MTRQRRVLVTGATGLLGLALLRRLQDQGVDVVGTSRSAPSDAGVQADLTDPQHVAVMLGRVAPTVVVHLAGSASGDRRELRRANVEATKHLMQAIARMDPPPAAITAGSAAEYGDPVRDPIGEDHPLRPVSEYGRAKAEQSTLVQEIASRTGLRTCVIRPFNIVSHELPPTVALGNMRRQLLTRADRPRRVRCGRLDVVRDFIPLAFVMDTIVRILELDEWPAILNVCSGVGVELGDLLNAMASELGVEVAVEVDPRLAAIPAAPRVVGDPTLLRGLGLEPRADVDELAALLMRSDSVATLG